MSATPRTDAIEERNGNVLCGSANLEFARTLERELAATERLRFGADADRRRLRDEVERLTAERDQLLAVLVHADQILDDIDTCSDAHKPMYSSYSQNVFKLCVKGRDARRAAIDAAMKP